MLRRDAEHRKNACEPTGLASEQCLDTDSY